MTKKIVKKEETKETKKFEISNRLFVFLIILLIGLLFSWAITIFVDYRNTTGIYPREITISAQGSVFVKPDIAMIKLGITSDGIKQQDLIRENKTKMDDIINSIKAVGIEEKDIEVVNYTLEPQFKMSENATRTLEGFILTNEIKVKIRNFDNIPFVIAKSTEKGANLISDLQYTLEDFEKGKKEALEKAINNAKEKAKFMAKQTNINLRSFVNIYEEYNYNFVEPGVQDILNAPLTQLGQQQITVRVNLAYKIK